MSAFFAFLHHIAAFTLVASLAIEFVLLRDELTLKTARKLPVVDAIFGVSAGVLLVVGFLRVFHFEKGATYYFHSWTFIAKIALFVLVGLLSIIPTREFLAWRKATRLGQVPAVTPDRMRRLRSIMHLELAGIVLIILFAAMMAKGVGLML
jgi:putative membrane protein